ncbi:MAG: hypothetical protein S4CHLAM2_05650 [Chlamydiales bacterium]|nr:hypothetical protein [Chlamydiales bacterium]
MAISNGNTPPAAVAAAASLYALEPELDRLANEYRVHSERQTVGPIEFGDLYTRTAAVAQQVLSDLDSLPNWPLRWENRLCASTISILSHKIENSARLIKDGTLDDKLTIILFIAYHTMAPGNADVQNASNYPLNKLYIICHLMQDIVEQNEENHPVLPPSPPRPLDLQGQGGGGASGY